MAPSAFALASRIRGTIQVTHSKASQALHHLRKDSLARVEAVEHARRFVVGISIEEEGSNPAARLAWLMYIFRYFFPPLDALS